jgi:membrane-associated phospholipid phosphatase
MSAGVEPYHRRWRPVVSGKETLFQRLDRWDRELSHLIQLTRSQQRPDNPRYWLAHLGAHLGDSWLWLLIAAHLWRNAYGEIGPAGARRRRTLLAWMGSVIAAVLLTMVLKQRIQRRRPSNQHRLYGAGPDVHSFPSGHASRMGAMVAWSSAVLPGWGLLAFPLAGWIGWSRIALGVHYPGDVIAGFVLGAGLGTAVRRRLFPRPGS